MIEASGRNAVPKSPSTIIRGKKFVMHRALTLTDEFHMARRFEISLSDACDESGELLASRSVAALVDIYNGKRFSGCDRMKSGV
jgi:hypothetical protein